MNNDNFPEQLRIYTRTLINLQYFLCEAESKCYSAEEMDNISLALKRTIRLKENLLKLKLDNLSEE